MKIAIRRYKESDALDLHEAVLGPFKHLSRWMSWCTAAARQAVQFAFQQLDFRRLEVHVLPENHASSAVACKLGATFEGTVRNKIFHNGESLPENFYSIIPETMGFSTPRANRQVIAGSSRKNAET